MRWISLISSRHSIHMQEYIFFSSEHGTFSRIDNIMSHKSNLSKFKKIEIVSNIFSDHNAMRLDINYKKKSVKNTNTWRLKNTFLNNILLKKSKGKSKNFYKQMTTKIQQFKMYGMQPKQF